MIHAVIRMLGHVDRRRYRGGTYWRWSAALSCQWSALFSLFPQGAGKA